MIWLSPSFTGTWSRDPDPRGGMDESKLEEREGLVELVVGAGEVQYGLEDGYEVEEEVTWTEE